jgi:hypothetical protein
MIPGGIAIVSNILSALAMQYTKTKAPVLFIVSLFPLAAAGGLYGLPKTPEWKSSNLAVYMILQVFQCMCPIVFSWGFANTAGHTKKTTTTGIMYIGLTVGNIVGPQLYLTREAPTYRTGLIANLVLLVVLSGLIITTGLYLTWLNHRNVKRRRDKGKTGRLVDYSLESSARWQGLREKQKNLDMTEEGHLEVHNAQAFLDLTDLQNEDFIYSF